MERLELQRFLGLLGLPARAPSLEALRQIVLSHMATIPFENISKLIRWKTTKQTDLPSLTEYLDGIEQYHFGGTCYTNNYYLMILLGSLGYDVRLCGADMSNPDVHIVNLVRVESREFLVDCGYASPLTEPLPRDLLEDFVIECANDRYVLRPQDSEGRSRLEFYRDGVARHSYIVKPRPRQIEEFNKVIADSFLPSATFMKAVLITRFASESSDVVHNMEYIATRGGKSSRSRFRSVEELAFCIQDVFGMPEELVRSALDGFSFDGDPWE